jgi:hypothetical protein
MTTYTLFGQPTESGTTQEGVAGTNGLHFTVSSASTFNGVWHYSPTGQTALPSEIGLYSISTANPATGTYTLLSSNSSPSWSGAAASGWVYAALTSGVALTSGTNYMATQFRDATTEWFVYTTGYTWPVTSGIITAPKDEGNGQGWYNTTTTTSMAAPTSQDAGYNWWIDVSISVTSNPPFIMLGYI